MKDKYPKYRTWCPVEIRSTLKIVENTEEGQIMTCGTCGKVWDLLKLKDGEHTPKDAYTEEEIERLKKKIEDLHNG